MVVEVGISAEAVVDSEVMADGHAADTVGVDTEAAGAEAMVAGD
jgi:hypothetical protein